ncbi:UNVERIFIED_CONTAM: SDR family NAD(P)-dependent oxidoreductase, partial [Salmonella enterica subsp. enterica serovar Weltevreden]
TGGIGLAAACELSRLGAKLVLVGRGARRLEAAAEAIEAFAGSPHGIRLIEAALSEPAQLEQAAARVLALETQLDVLVNNAGVLLHRRELSSDGHERSMAVNLLAPLRLTQRLLPLLAASRGRVIN